MPGVRPPKLVVLSPVRRREETAQQLREYAKHQGLTLRSRWQGGRGFVAMQAQADGSSREVFRSLDRSVFYNWVSRALARDEDDIPLDLI